MTAMPELYTNGAQILHTNRRRVQPIGGLSQAQLEWCRANLKGFAWPRVQRLARPDDMRELVVALTYPSGRE